MSQSTRHDFYTYIDLPRNYIERHDAVLSDARALLLNPVPSDSASSQFGSRLIVLHGMAGTGKTVLARALCDDETIQKQFHHGILGATLGQNPDLISIMREWLYWLGEPVGEYAPTKESLQVKLKKILKDRAYLLFLDDVWKRTHIEGLMVGGRDCCLLCTMLNARFAKQELGAIVLEIPVMMKEDAIILLEKWANGQLNGTDIDIKERIVERLGRLPLAVTLAGVQLQDNPAEQWLQTFDIRTSLESGSVEKPHDSLKITLDLSLEALDPKIHDLYTSLAIFKENEVIPESVILRLWQELAGKDALQTKKVLDDLAERALLDITKQTPTRTISMHRLLHDLINSELTTEKRESTHKALLQAYHDFDREDHWYQVENDGYFHDHLVYHLLGANEQDALKSLFVDQIWLRTRVPQRGYIYDGYLEDLSLAWQETEREAKQQIDLGKEPFAIAECLRYLLIQTSVNGIIKNYLPEVVQRALEEGKWHIKRALSVATMIPDSQRRISMYKMMLSLKSDIVTREQQLEIQNLAIGTLQNMKDQGKQVSLLSSLAPLLSEEQHHSALAQVLQRVLSLTDEEKRVGLLSQLASQLTDTLLDQALQSVWLLKDEGKQINLLSSLAQKLPEEQYYSALERVLCTVSSLDNEERRSRLLSQLVPQLTDNLLDQALQAIESLKNEERKVELISVLAPKLSGEQLYSALEEALEIILAVETEGRQRRLFSQLIIFLTGSLLEKAVKRVLAFKDEVSQVTLLRQLAPQLTGKLLDEALQVARSVKDEESQVILLSSLAPQLLEEQSSPVLEQAFRLALDQTDEGRRANLLRGLIPLLTGSLLEETLAAALSVKDEVEKVMLISSLAPKLSEEQRYSTLDQALQGILKLPDEKQQAELLSQLIPLLTGSLFEQAFHAILFFKDEKNQAELILQLVPQLSGSQLDQALKAARSLNDDERRVVLLNSLAPKLLEEQRHLALEQALQTTLKLPDEERQEELLSQLAPLLTGSLLEQALQAALVLDDESGRTQLLRPLVSELASSQLEIFLPLILTLNERRQIELLSSFASRLPRPLLEQTLQTVLSINDEGRRAELLGQLASQLTDKLLDQALQAALELKDEERNKDLLSSLAPQLSEQQLHMVLESAKDERKQARLLSQLVPSLTDSQLVPLVADPFIQQIVQRTLILKDEISQITFLSQLAPLLTGSLLERALYIAHSLDDKENETLLLCSLVPQLSEDQRHSILEQSLQTTLNLPYEEQQIKLLDQLAPLLTDSLLEQAFQAALSISDERGQTEHVLQQLVLRMTDRQLKQTLHVALELKDEERRAVLLSLLAPRLLEEDRHLALKQALEATLKLKDEQRLTELLSQLAPLLTNSLLKQALQAALSLKDEWGRIGLLALLSSRLPDENALANFRTALTKGLSSSKLLSRQEILTTLYIASIQKVFSSILLTEEIAIDIIKVIIEICEVWHWL